MNYFLIVFIVAGSCFVYELFIKPYFQKRNINRIEKLIIQWVNLINNFSVVDNEDEKRKTNSFLVMYQNTKFTSDQMALKLEVAKLMYIYLNTILGVLCQNGIQMTAFNRNDAEGTVDKLITLEQRQHQLENIL